MYAVDVDTYGKEGYAVRFPYSPDVVATIKQCLGLKWDKNIRAWVSQGGEVLLDLERFGFQPRWSYAAQERAKAFQEELYSLIDVKVREVGREEFDYQRVGTDILKAGKRIILADAPGLGKTKQALDAMYELGRPRNLVVCQKTALYNWENEVRIWHPDMEAGIVPREAKLRRTFWENPPQLVISSYERLFTHDWPHGIEWDIIAFDEAQKFKNYQTKTFKNAKQMARRAEYAWALTGSPLELNLGELFNIYNVIRPGLLGDWMRFSGQHVFTDWNGQPSGAKNIELLRDRIAFWMVRRDKSLVKLPEKLSQDLLIELSEEERKSYNQIKRKYKDWLIEEGRDLKELNPLTRLVHLSQFLCSPKLLADEDNEALEQRGAKWEAFKDLQDGWPGRIVVFSSFSEMTRLLRQWCSEEPSIGYNEDAFIDGDVEERERFRRIDAFNAGGLGRVLITTDAGQTSINLVGADMVVHWNPLWNPQKMGQREDRLHRIGQRNTVHVIRMMLKDTLDVGQYKILKEREELFKSVIEGNEDVIFKRLGINRIVRALDGDGGGEE